MKRFFTLLLIATIPLLGFSQDDKEEEKGKKGETEQKDEDKNYIKNPSFEKDNGKLKKLGQIDYADDWNKTTKIKADLFTKGGYVGDIDIPTNFYGKCPPSYGDNYAGIVYYSQAYKVQKNYITSELKKSLSKDKRYCFKMDVSLSDLSKFAVNNVGISLSKKDPTDVESKMGLLDQNRITSRANNVIDETGGWETICVPFTAKGFEKFITIGNFAPEKEMVTKKMYKPEGESREQVQLAYYYIDNLELVEISADAECTCKRDKDEGPNIVFSKSTALDENASLLEKITGSTVYFFPNKSELTPAAKADLDFLAEVLSESANTSITIIGHMDDKEDKKSNERDYYRDISKERAENVKDYLTEKGIDSSRLSTKYMKNSKPATKMKTPLSLAKNRRVEFVL